MFKVCMSTRKYGKFFTQKGTNFHENYSCLILNYAYLVKQTSNRELVFVLASGQPKNK